MFAASVVSAFAFAFPAQVQNDQLSIAAIRLGVTDIKASVEFYTKHLGCESAGDFSDFNYAMLENHGVMLVLTPVTQTVSIGEDHCHARINFAVKDLDEAMASMKASGVRFLGEKTSAVGRYATFLDPSGNQHNIKQLNQPEEEIGSPRIYDVGISVSDMTKATDFYINTLGFEELTRKYYPPVVPTKQRGCTFFILSEGTRFNAPYAYGRTAHCGLALAVADLDAEVKRLRGKGVKFLHDQPQAAGDVRYIAFADPFGNVHELITHTDDHSHDANEKPDDQHVSTHAPKASDLAWMAGTWKLDTDTSDLEETWSSPRDGGLLGAFRWHRDGKPWMYELMSIQEESGTLVFRLRHFDATLKPWEEKDPLSYRHVSGAENEVVFENAMPPDPSHVHPKRIVYRMIKGGGADRLIVRLEPPEDHQQAREFVFTRAE